MDDFTADFGAEDQEVFARALGEAERVMLERHGDEDGAEAFYALLLATLSTMFRRTEPGKQQALATWLNEYLEAGEVGFRLVPVS